MPFLCTDVPRVPASRAVSCFDDEFFVPHRPVVFTGVDIDNGGTRDWSASALAAKHGRCDVETRVFDSVRAGAHVRFAGLMKRTERMPLGRFLAQTLEPAEQHETMFESHYLRLDATRNTVPGLLDGVRFPPLFTRDDWLVHDTFLRIGPADYEYPAHCDNLENVLLQLHGRKEVLLFEPASIAAMYPDPRDLARSQVDDIDAPDLLRFPAFAMAPRRCCVLEPGDALYIPMLWFHDVRSIGHGVSSSRSYRRADHLAYIIQSKPREWHEFETRLGRRVY